MTDFVELSPFLHFSVRLTVSRVFEKNLPLLFSIICDQSTKRKVIPYSSCFCITCISITDTIKYFTPASIAVYQSLCVFFPSILNIKFVGRTSRGHTGGRSHRIFIQHLLSAVRALFFLARRIQPFLSLVDREVEFCVLTI